MTKIKKIEKALSEWGMYPVKIRWEPIGKGMEMCGPSGGWFVEAADPIVDKLYIFLGYSIDELLFNIHRPLEFTWDNEELFNDLGFRKDWEWTDG
jgi:hypothetical protein